MKRRYLAAVAAVVIAGGAVAFGLRGPETQANAPRAVLPDGALVAVSVPTLSTPAAMGQTVFNAKCASCHGVNAAGREGAGPPLVHKYYEPNHHGDGAFLVAARRGVQAHHWRFGNMPPVQGVTDAEIAAVIAYVRALQKANGIY